MSIETVDRPYVYKPSASILPDKPPIRAGVFGLVAWTLISFVIVGALIAQGNRMMTGAPYIGVMTEKFEDFSKASNEYDVVFLGSSQTFRHIDAPEISEKSGLKVYNFGVPALTEPEMRLVADYVIEHKGERLKYAVVQNPLRAEGVMENMISDRGRYFRAGERIADTVKDVVCYTGTTMGTIKRVKNNAQSMTAEQIGLGRLAQTVFPDPNAGPLVYNDGYRSNDGYWPVDQDGSDHVAIRHEKTPMTPKLMERYLAGKADYVPTQAQADCRAAQLLETIDDLRAAGLQVFYFVSPNPKETRHDRIIADAVRRADPSLVVIDFGSPEAYPDLFKPELWFDQAHMNGAGAKTLADVLGGALSEAVGQSPRLASVKD